MAVLVLLARATGARIVAAHVREVDRFFVFGRGGLRALRTHLFTAFGRSLCFLRHLNLHVHEHAAELLAHVIQKRLKHREGFALVFLLGLLLGVTAQVNPLSQGIERRDVLTPGGVQNLQKHVAGKTGPGFVADQLFLTLFNGIGRLKEFLQKVFIGDAVVFSSISCIGMSMPQLVLS